MPPTPRRRSIEVQGRDLEILRGLFESRVMTAGHVADLYFGGRYEAARKRLQGLKAAGYVGQRPRRAYDPAVLFLTRQAFALLCERGAIADYPPTTWAGLEKRVRVSDLTLRHELAVMDVKSAVVKAVAGAGSFNVTEFGTWPMLYQFRAMDARGRPVTVKPDGFLRVHERTDGGEAFEHTFFLEVDRSTETLDTLVRRALAYRDYYRRGGLAVRCGRPAAEFESFPFRVLMVFLTAERRNNAAAALLLCRPPILTQVWLTTLGELTTEPLGSIWVRPADYRAAVAGSAYEPGTPSQANGYRRNGERETFVEGRVVKGKMIFEHEVGPSASPIIIGS